MTADQVAADIVRRNARSRLRMQVAAIWINFVIVLASPPGWQAGAFGLIACLLLVATIKGKQWP